MNNLELGEAVKLFNMFNCYTFIEDNHTYYYNDEKVECSVTQFIKRYFKEFDKDGIAGRYAIKHNLVKEDVIKEWEKSGKISSLTGTAIHSYMENINRGKILNIDFSEAKELGLYEDVKKRFDILLPKAKAFYQSMKNKLYPIQLEYTVGYNNKLAGNIDMLCWNDYAKEFQIWDYKNTKEIKKENPFGEKCFSPFNFEDDCNFIHYSIQLNTYKALLERATGIKIGKMYLVHFNYTKDDDSFEIIECKDFQNEIKTELCKLM